MGSVLKGITTRDVQAHVHAPKKSVAERLGLKKPKKA